MTEAREKALRIPEDQIAINGAKPAPGLQIRFRPKLNDHALGVEMHLDLANGDIYDSVEFRILTQEPASWPNNFHIHTPLLFAGLHSDKIIGHAIAEGLISKLKLNISVQSDQVVFTLKYSGMETSSIEQFSKFQHAFQISESASAA